MGLVHDGGEGLGLMDDGDGGGLEWWTVVRRCVSFVRGVDMGSLAAAR